jgi:hypothetical protein
MAEIWGIAAAGIVGAVGGALISGNAAQSAAQTQAGAENNASALQMQMFQQTQGNLAPFMTSGKNALAGLDFGLGIGPNSGGPSGMGYGSLVKPFSAAQYQQSPGYSWQMSQGIDAVQNSASAAGGIGGGNTLKALTTYGQGLANTDYQQAYQNYVGQQQQQYNMLSGVANSGQNAAANLGGLSSQVGNSVGNNIVGAGNALAGGTLGVAGAASGGLNSLTQLASLYGSGGYGSAPLNTSSGSINPMYAPQSGLVQTPTFYCDYALKDNIKPFYFDHASGLQVYSFRYKSIDDRWTGYLAQDVQKKYPEAVSAGPRGFLKVDYSKIPKAELRKPTLEEWDELDELGAVA